MTFVDTSNNEDETSSTTNTSDSRISDTLIRQITRIRLNPDKLALTIPAGRDARGTFSFEKLRHEHPIATVAAGSILVAAISPPLLVGALNVVGFGSGGVAAGSIAAGAQSVLYGGATTGLFAACQSAGAAGLGATATAVTSVVGGATARLALLGRRKRNDNEDTVTQSEEEVVYSFEPEPSSSLPYDE